MTLETPICHTRPAPARTTEPHPNIKVYRIKELSLFLIAAILFSWGEDYAIPQLGLDPGWQEGLVNATDNGRLFGKEIIFTYGPFHQLYTHLISINLQSLLIGRWLLGLSAGAAAVTFSRITSPSWAWSLTVSLWLLPARNPDGLFGVLATIYIFGCLWLGRTRSASILLYLIYLGLILGIYTKLSFLGCAIPAIAAGAALRAPKIDSQTAWEKTLTSIALLAAPWPLLWILSGQPASSLTSYFSIGNLDIITGYSSSMQASDVSQAWQPLTYVLAAIMVLMVLRKHLAKHQSNHAKTVITISSLATISWAELKAGMVRQDFLHETISIFYLYSLFFIVLSIIHSARFMQTAQKAGFSSVLIPTAMPILISLQPIFSNQAPFSKLGSLAANFNLLVGSSTSQSSRDDLLKLRNHRLADLKTETEKLPVPPGATADILPWDISNLITQGINYKPRPIIQSYSAYTPTLQLLNARHFESTARPSFVVLRNESIDDRTPLEMDAPALFTIARNYRLYARGSRGSLILKAHSPRPSHRSTLLWQKQLKGTDLRPDPETKGFSTDRLTLTDLKKGSYLSISLKPSLTRKIQSTIFKSPPLTLEILYPNRQSIRVRIVDKPRNIIPLNPYIHSNDDLAAFLQTISGSERDEPPHPVAGLDLRILAPSNFAGVDEIMLLVHGPDGVLQQ